MKLRILVVICLSLSMQACLKELCPDSEAVMYRADLDGDGWGDDSHKLLSCEAEEGWVEEGGDCDDEDALVNPAAIESPNGVDDDCDALIDEED